MTLLTRVQFLHNAGSGNPNQTKINPSRNSDYNYDLFCVTGDDIRTAPSNITIFSRPRAAYSNFKNLNLNINDLMNIAEACNDIIAESIIRANSLFGDGVMVTEYIHLCSHLLEFDMGDGGNLVNMMKRDGLLYTPGHIDTELDSWRMLSHLLIDYYSTNESPPNIDVNWYRTFNSYECKKFFFPSCEKSCTSDCCKIRKG